MKATTLFFCFFSIFLISINAQEVEYVITEPKEAEKKEFKKPTQSDSNSIANPDYISYFLNSTAYTLNKKKIRLSGTDIIFIKGSYGITDNTMASVNISVFGTFTGSVKQQINLSDYIKAGVSVTGGRIIYYANDGSANQSYSDSSIYMVGGQAMITLGDRQDNLTIGTGFYYVRSNLDLFGNGPENIYLNDIYIGFQKQLGKRFYLMGEGMYFVGQRVFTGALGIKFVLGDKMALTFGIMPFGGNDPSTNSTYVAPIAIPLISFRLLLGRN
jgi:hypothetical protein